MDYSLLINAVPVLVLGYLVFRLFVAKNDKQGANEEVAELKTEIAVLKEKNENLDAAHLQKIQGLQRLLDEKQNSLDNLLKDKNEQIENLKKERSSVIEDVKNFLGKDFQATSHNVFDKANKKLFSQFENYFESKNKLAKKDIEGIVNPINEVLNQLSSANKSFADTYQRDFSAIESLVGQTQKTMEQTILETAKLSTALKGSTKSAGRWGEEQLRRILEMSQMSEHSDFIEQDTINDGSRPDVIVRLPGDRQIVIDSKASVKDYIESLETDDPAQRKILLASHAQKIRAHMQSLSKKKYWDNLETTVDMVVMFVPGENFLNAALQEDPQIFQEALKSKVLIAGPQNLFVTLKTMGMMWSKDKQTKEAGRIIEIGKELLRRVQTMTGHLATLGDNIRKTGNSYNSFIGSMDTKFLPKAQELSNFFPELEEKKKKKPELVENAIKESSKIVSINQGDHDRE
jgi:DNA recombination protein RmuC